eukprot:g4476.t1
MSASSLTREEIRLKLERAEMLRAQIADASAAATQAEEELEERRAQLAQAKEKWRKNPHVKSFRTREDTRDEIELFLARRVVDEGSVLRKKAEDRYEREVEASLEKVRREKERAQLQKLKQEYLVEREESTTRMGVVSKPSPKERRDLIHAAVNGKWTGTAPSSRLGLGVESGSKRKGSGAKPLDEIATRFPHSLFEQQRQ